MSEKVPQHERWPVDEDDNPISLVLRTLYVMSNTTKQVGFHGAAVSVHEPRKEISVLDGRFKCNLCFMAFPISRTPLSYQPVFPKRSH